MNRPISIETKFRRGLVAVATLACLLPGAALAQEEGGLYVAGYGFSFQEAAERGLAQNPRNARFFVLSLPPDTGALLTSAPRSAAALREHGLGLVITNAGELPRFDWDAAANEPGDAGLLPYFRDRSLLARVPARTAPRPGVAAAADVFLREVAEDSAGKDA